MPISDHMMFGSGLISSLLLIQGLYFYLWHPIDGRKTFYEILFQDGKYIGVALATSGLINIASAFTTMPVRTSLIYSLEGSIVTVFQTFTHPVLTLFFAFIYMVGFPSMLLLTYFKLKATNRIQAKKYLSSYVALILVSVPMFYLLPVGVTGYYLESVEPLLYEFHPLVNGFMTTVDTLTKSFPSLHAGLALLAAFHARHCGKRYRNIAWITACLVVFSTLYLGIHWVIDLVAGGLLAYAGYRYSAQTTKVLTTVEEWAVRKFPIMARPKKLYR